MIKKFETPNVKNENDDFSFVDERLLQARESEEDRDVEIGLRPQSLDEYVGQEKAK